jgi:hypothetical protein
MTEYLQYILSVIGAGWFITSSELLKPFREYISSIITPKIKSLKWLLNKVDGVVNCIYCCSFWIAIFGYYLVQFNNDITHCIINAFSILGFIYVVKNINK